MTFGDALALLGLALAVLLYEAQRIVERRREIGAAIQLLDAVSKGIQPWGDLYFGGGGYDEDGAKEHARTDYQQVMEKHYNLVFRVPAEPLVALIGSPAAGGLIGETTIQLANATLWQIGVFNQLVQQQTDFLANHLAEISDETLPRARREALANAAGSISSMLHRNGIGDAVWYVAFMEQLRANRMELARRARRWWTRPSLALAVVFVIGALIAATWTGLDDRGGTPRDQLPKPTTTTRG